MRPPQSPCAGTGTIVPLITSATLGWCCASPPDITCVSSIHPHARRASGAGPDTLLIAYTDVVSASTITAMRWPSGDRCAGVGAGTDRPPIVYDSVQFSMLALLLASDSQTTPAGVGAPATTQVGPPIVNLRVNDEGSTTWNSRGPQHRGLPPWAQARTLATIRLVVPRHPVGQRP